MDFDAIVGHFAGEAIIEGVEGVLKSGKEAVVYRCAAHPSTGLERVALKVYKDIERRSFRDMAGYLEGRIGRTVRKRRDILHMLSDSETMQGHWVEAEYHALASLHDAGLPVPRPLGLGPSSLAMEFVGGDEAAPRLRDVHLEPEEARSIRDELVAAVRGMLERDTIHGDLSAYNVLVHEGRPVMIDFPQAVDARYHSRGAELLERDLVNVLSHFERLGLGGPDEGRRLAAEWWGLYERNAL